MVYWLQLPKYLYQATIKSLGLSHVSLGEVIIKARLICHLIIYVSINIAETIKPQVFLKVWIHQFILCTSSSFQRKCLTGNRNLCQKAKIP